LYRVLEIKYSANYDPLFFFYNVFKRISGTLYSYNEEFFIVPSGKFGASKVLFLSLFGFLTIDSKFTGMEGIKSNIKSSNNYNKSNILHIKLHTNFKLEIRNHN
ncbi:hypothetical protein ACJX0J_034028, partial [Zea mays]